MLFLILDKVLKKEHKHIFLAKQVNVLFHEVIIKAVALQSPKPLPTLIEPIRVDIGGDVQAPRGSFIPAGTIVASHYVFFDSLDGIHYGHVDFDAPILGIATFQDTMAATDFLANTNVTYLSLELRGLERGDEVWIDADDPHRLYVYWAGSSPGDYIRVFTAQSSAAPLM